jgi:hypothetical protein
MAKTVVCCPKYKTPQKVTRSDSNHPFWSIEKSSEAEEKVSSLNSQYKNSDCKEKFNINWYNKYNYCSYFSFSILAKRAP